MRKLAIGLASLMLVGSALGCCVLPQLRTIRIPEIEIHVPTVEIGELIETEEVIPASGKDSVEVAVVFGAGQLQVSAGDSEQLLVGRFAYNVQEWEPEVTYEDGELTVRQGSTEGVPTGVLEDMRNEWRLAFSPEVPLEMDIKIGAGEGSLDLTGLQLTELDLDLGAGDLEVRFDEPNRADLRQLTVDSGASSVNVVGIGNAGPERVRVQGGAGELTLDFTGEWCGSAEVTITAGIGQVTLRLPADVGVRVEKRGGVTSIDAPDFRKLGDAYVNDVFGETEIELRISITAGVGNIELIEVAE